MEQVSGGHESGETPLSSSPTLSQKQGKHESDPSASSGDEDPGVEVSQQNKEDLVKELKQKLEEAESETNRFSGCLKDYFCCMVVREKHSLILNENEEKYPLHVKQAALKDYLNGEAKQRLLCAIGFLLVALFCLGAMNFMENLDEMFGETTNCKVNFDVSKHGGSGIRKDPLVVARLPAKHCPPPEMDHITLEQNERLQVKKVKCDNPQTETNEDSDCYNMFKCDKKYANCQHFFPLTANIN